MVGQPIAFGAENQCQFFDMRRIFGRGVQASGQFVQRDRAILKCHRHSGEAQRLQFVDALEWPVMFVLGAVFIASGDTGPRNLKYRAHRYAGGAAVERITARGRDQHGIHIERGRGTHQRTHIGVIHNILHHSYATSILTDLGHGG